jgi:hypothetical protein
MGKKSKLNPTILLLIILLFLAGGYFGWQYWQKQQSGKGEDLLFGKIDINQISKIEIGLNEEGVDKNIILEVKDKKWYVASEKFLPAEIKLINDGINSLNQIKIKELVSTNPARQPEYQVDNSGIRVKVYQGEQKTMDFYAGKNGPFFPSGYFRREGENNVYLVSENLQNLFYKPSWLDSVITEIISTAITKITWQYPGLSFTLEKKDDKWLVNSKLAKADKVENLLKTISNLTALDVAYAEGEVKNSNLILTIEANGLTKLSFNKEGENYLARKEGDNRQFTLGSYLYEQLAVKLADLE